MPFQRVCQILVDGRIDCCRCVCVRTCRQCFLVGGADILREGGIAATSEYPLKNANKRVAMPFFYTSSSFPPPKLEPIYCRFRWHWFSKLTFPFSFRHPRRDVCTAQRGVPRKEKEERKIRADMADQVSGKQMVSLISRRGAKEKKGVA